MAISTPVTIGEGFLGGTWSSGRNLTTTAAVPAGAKIIFVAMWASPTANNVAPTMSGGGLSWQADLAGEELLAPHRAECHIFSADAPSGLASGSTLTITATGSSSWGVHYHAFYVEGLETSSYLDGTSFDATSVSAGTWTSPTIATANADDLLVGAVLGDGQGAAGSFSWGSSFTKIGNDTYDSATNQWNASIARRIVSSTGTYGHTGTFPETMEFGTLMGLVAYKAAVTGPPPQTIRPDADTTTTGWTATPLFSKVNDSSDATVITGTLS